ncbi:ABC transporter permease [Olivibacter sitiensis]|uniref:ABC transporter permease n=1 Tax=Olivibacter sitiensis TaxID=376470 RepID=UPI000414F06F|nr:ABC transporter permease [Olivibacter sitiensis]
MKRTIALIKREFQLFFQDGTLRSVFFLAPIAYALIIGFVYKQGKVEDLPIIVVDMDDSPLSNQVVDMLGDNERLDIVSLRHENVQTNDELISKKAVITLVIPNRFEADVLQRRYPEINVYINTANLLTANLASQSVQTTLGTFNAGVNMQSLKKRGMSSAQAQTQYEPFKANYIRLFNETGNYFIFMWPAILAVVLQQVILLAMAVSFAREYKMGTFQSVLMKLSHSNPFITLFVKVLPFWILAIPIVGVFYGFHFIFQAPIPERPLQYLLTTGLFVMSCSFLGALVSAVLTTPLKSTQALMLLSTPAFIIGGYTWPTSAMPLGIRLLADVLPLTPFLEAHKIMLIEQGSLHDVQPELRFLVGQTLVYFILCILVLKYKFWLYNKRSNRKNIA